MTWTYDKYYQTENFFGDPYPELMEFFKLYPGRGKVLDLGSGQGRDAIALARLGYEVTGIDRSRTGIEQMKKIAEAEKLHVVGEEGDIYGFNKFDAFDIILLDSMFHFTKKDKVKEIGLIRTIISGIKNGSLVVFCIQDAGNKVQILNQAIDCGIKIKRLMDREFKYVFEEPASGHQSKTDYRMIVIEK